METSTETIYSSMRDGAKALNCLVGSIAHNVKNGKKPFPPPLRRAKAARRGCVRGRYVIKKL